MAEMAEMAPEAVNPEDAQRKLLDALKGIVGRLESEATDRVGKRQSLERRWIEDLEQYHGRYDTETEKALRNGDKSKLFINLTRPKTDAMEARLTDLLFPTDDKNWGIGPTPVPSLTKGAKDAVAQARQKAEEAKAAAAGGDPAMAQAAAQEANLAQQKANELNTVIEEASRRAELMAQEIDDQLKQSNYHAAMRDVIGDAAKLGTGVCKGPVTGDKVRKGWKKVDVADGNGNVSSQYQLQMATGDHPSMRYVDIWSFFPDMDARTIEESQGVYERHLMNKKKFRELSKLPGFDQDAIRKLLKDGPSTSAPAYLADLRNLNKDSQQIAKDLYHVWEYSGPIDAEDMRTIAEAVNDEAVLSDLAEIDPLQETYAIVWFCQGELLKFSIYPFDSGECMYSVFNLAKDEASIFGYGIPSIMRDPQKALNAGWRMMMDNAGLSTGPQIVIATDMVEPADGDYVLRPRKIWKAIKPLTDGQRAFQTFEIDMHQAELANIIQISKNLIDEMTAMPQIAQGEQGSTTKTVQGMSLLMNSANVVFRRIVKNFDDDVTAPNIRRFYDWNMQFNPKEEIKGDYDVDARGSSVLLVREMQAQNLMVIAIQLGAHPVYGPMLKNKGVLRKLFQAQMIPAEEVMLSDEEIDAVMANAAAQAQAQAQGADQSQAIAEMEMARLEAEIEMKNLEWGTKLEVAKLNRETALITMAEKMNMKLDELEARLVDKEADRTHKEKLIAVETAMTQQIGPTGGGMF
jgi:hypothetical protein